MHDVLCANDVIDRLARSLRARIVPSYLIEEPPCCDRRPPILKQVVDAIGQNRPDDVRIALLSVDVMHGEQDLVDQLKKQWIGRDDEQCRAWAETELDNEISTQATRLIRLVRYLEARRMRPVAFLDHFDKMFRHMSSQLLAAMRSLEMDGMLACVNLSTLPYDELYRLRAADEGSFVSDYGQEHRKLVLSVLSRAEAEEAWQAMLPFPLDGRLATGCFDLAYEWSASLPVAFRKALHILAGFVELPRDVRQYRTALQAELPDSFRRLFQHDPAAELLVPLVTRLHLGVASKSDEAMLRGHRWSSLLCYVEGDVVRLRSEAIGLIAADLAQKTHVVSKTARAPLDPSRLYVEGRYRAVLNAVGENPPADLRVLAIAAEIMEEVFGASPRSLYFPPTIRWKRVAELAARAEALVIDKAAAEFAAWRRLAEVLGATPAPHKRGVAAHIEHLAGLGTKGVDSAIVELGVRWHAIRHDPNPATAAHMAIPLVEDVLRHYLWLIVGIADRGRGFQSASDEDIKTWWARDVPFRRPPDDEPLSGASLVLLVACSSTRGQRPVFDSPTSCQRLIQFLDDTRNLLGHYVTTPRPDTARQLVAEAEKLLLRLTSDGRATVSLEMLDAWLRAPRAFLAGRVET